jgi:hypothetical protein
MGIYGPAIVVVNLILLVSGKTSELIIFSRIFLGCFRIFCVYQLCRRIFAYTTSAALRGQPPVLCHFRW